MVVDEARIQKAILSGLPLTITTFTLPREMEAYIESVLTIFLKFSGQEKLKDHLFYCIRELAGNAKKANTKRVYFLERGLDIYDPHDYEEGIKHFKKTTLNNIDHYLKKQKEMGLYIKLFLQTRKNIINIEIRNNTVLTPAELFRIHDRLIYAQQFNSLEEAFSQVLDDSEGAGLGLVILALMLKKMQLSKDCFDIRISDKETIAHIKIPLDRVYVENISKLSTVIADSVDSLPQFPENIMSIQRLLANPDVKMREVAKRLSMDPALTAGLLKVVNSAQFMLAKQTDNILEAIKIVGIRGLKNLLFSYGTVEILGDETKEKKQLWSHSNKTAFYAFNLVKNFKHGHDFLDDVFVSGILHDMGKIIFSSAHPELLNKIRRFCKERNIPNSTFEYLSAGMNHAEIGALVAEKWNFPDSLIAAIRYHPNPTEAPENYRELVESIYLANMFCKYENGNAAFDQFAEGPLVSYGITDKKQLDVLLDRFSRSYKNVIH